MRKRGAIAVNPERWRRLKERRDMTAEEYVDIFTCLFRYLLDGIEPPGKSPKFMEAFEYMCEDAEAVWEEDSDDA